MVLQRRVGADNNGANASHWAVNAVRLGFPIKNPVF